MRSSKKLSSVRGYIPSGVAWMKASKCRESTCSRSRGSAPHTFASARTRSGLRPTSDTLAPASASAKAALRAAPPLPASNIDDLPSRIRRESGPFTDSASVLAPRHWQAVGEQEEILKLLPVYQKRQSVKGKEKAS